MVDTQRDKAALAALFADNVSGDISPQDLRDFLESMHPSALSYYVSSSAETTIVTQSVYVKVAGTTTQVSARGFTHSNNRATYTGTPDIHVFITASVSMTAAGTNVITAWRAAKNGTTIASSEVQRKVGTGTDIGALFIAAEADLSTNDYIEIFCANESDTTNMTADYMYVHVLQVFK